MDIDTVQSGTVSSAQEISSPISTLTLFNMSRDMKFMGVMYIIFGGLYCLTIFGALLGVPWLISGLRLRDSADLFNNFAVSKNANFLQSAIDQQSRFFRIQKILLIVTLVLTVVVVIVAIAAGLFFSRNPYTYQS